MENNKKNSLKESFFWQRLCSLVSSLYFSRKQVKKEDNKEIGKEIKEEKPSNIKSDKNSLNQVLNKFGSEKFERIELINLLKISIERLFVGSSLDITDGFIQLLDKSLKQGEIGKNMIALAFEGKINDVKSINISSFVKEIPNPNIFSIFKNVENFFYDGGVIKNFDLRVFGQLKKVTLINKGLETIKIQGRNNLEYAYLKGNKFKELNFTGCYNLEEVDVSANPNLTRDNIIGLPKKCKVIGLKRRKTFLGKINEKIRQISLQII